MSLFGLPTLPSIIILISTCIYIFVLFRSKFFYIYVFIILAFSFGVIDVLFSAKIGKAAISAYSFLFFARSAIEIYWSKKRFFLPGIYIVILIVSSLLLSYIIDVRGSPLYGLFYMMENIIRSYLIFLAIINLYITADHLARIKKIYLFCIIIQILVAFYKLYFIGIQEKLFIGTISSREGSVTTAFVMIMVSLFLAYFLYSYRFKYLIMAGFIIFFGIVNAKRAILFFIPIISVCILGLHVFFDRFKPKSSHQNVVGYLFTVAIFCFISVYLTVVFNPSLNPEKTVGGSFNIDYLVSYINDYITSEGDREKNTLYNYRRYDALFYLLDKGWKESIFHFIFGQGAGHLVASATFIGNTEIPSIAYYGIRYGARTGFLFYFLQIGLLGVCLIIILHLKFFIDIFSIFRKERSSIEVKALSLAAMGWIIAFFIDFITYSHSFYHSFSISFLYFSLLGLIYRARYTVNHEEPQG